MKKRIIRIMALSLVIVMGAGSLTGCGTRAKATDIAVEDEETIIVNEEDMETETEVEDTEDSDDEILDSEVIGGDTESKEENSYTEHEFFYIKDSVDFSNAIAIDVDALDTVNSGTYDLQSTVDIYGRKGAVIGYTKENISVYVMNTNEEWYQLYFENEEPSCKYVFVKTDDFMAATNNTMNEKVLTTIKQVRDEFEEFFNNLEYDTEEEKNYEFLDVPNSDMEYTDIKLPMYCDGSEMLNLTSWISQSIVKNGFSNYETFCIEEIEDEFDEEYLWFRVYYK